MYYAQVVELAYILDLKSSAFGIEGSNPSLRTNFDYAPYGGMADTLRLGCSLRVQVQVLLGVFILWAISLTLMTSDFQSDNVG